MINNQNFDSYIKNIIYDIMFLVGIYIKPISIGGQRDNSFITDLWLILNKLRGLSLRANYTEEAKVVPTFADRRCHVVSVTDPYGHNFGFLDQSRYD
jgi:hypothetical protein